MTLLPDVNLHPDDSASGCEPASGCEFQRLSSNLPPCQIIFTEAQPKVYGAHVGPPYNKISSHSQNDQNTLGFLIMQEIG